MADPFVRAVRLGVAGRHVWFSPVVPPVVFPGRQLQSNTSLRPALRDRLTTASWRAIRCAKSPLTTPFPSAAPPVTSTTAR